MNLTTEQIIDKFLEYLEEKEYEFVNGNLVDRYNNYEK